MPIWFFTAPLLRAALILSDYGILKIPRWAHWDLILIDWSVMSAVWSADSIWDSRTARARPLYVYISLICRDYNICVLEALYRESCKSTISPCLTCCTVINSNLKDINFISIIRSLNGKLKLNETYFYLFFLFFYFYSCQTMCKMRESLTPLFEYSREFFDIAKIVKRAVTK